MYYETSLLKKLLLQQGNRMSGNAVETAIDFYLASTASSYADSLTCLLI
jgi:hypothetical protein